MELSYLHEGSAACSQYSRIVLESTFHERLFGEYDDFIVILIDECNFYSFDFDAIENQEYLYEFFLFFLYLFSSFLVIVDHSRHFAVIVEMVFDLLTASALD